MYIGNYYENLYKEEEFDGEYQEWFMNYVTKTLTTNEIASLCKNVSESEIFKAIKDMNLKKAPGLDGRGVYSYHVSFALPPLGINY